MKNRKLIREAARLVQDYSHRIWKAFFYPLKDIPVPDFNNEYDSTML